VPKEHLEGNVRPSVEEEKSLETKKEENKKRLVKNKLYII
tara:strand:- start:342 stop:461 length:120 start_codon:yes stop_codon:yes gene_type:complete